MNFVFSISRFQSQSIITLVLLSHLFYLEVSTEAVEVVTIARVQFISKS